MSVARSICSRAGGATVVSTSARSAGGRRGAGWKRTNGLAELEDRARRDQRLLVVILDLDVDDVHRPVEVAAAVQQVCRSGEEGASVSAARTTQEAGRQPRTFADGVEAALLARDDNVGHGPRLVPALGRFLDLAVAVDHVEDAVGRVTEAEREGKGADQREGSAHEPRVRRRTGSCPS